MKIAAQQVESVIRDPSRFAGLLIYGEDWGQVRTRAAAAAQAVLGVAADPFRLSILVKEEHGRLRQEVTSLALGGGRRVIRVQDATDALAVSLDTMGDHRADALVVVEAAALAPRSKLRVMAEKHVHWASIACYPERAAAIQAEISRAMSAAGLSVQPDALSFLADELTGESVRRRAELEKLALYCAGEKMVTLADAQQCCSAELEASLGAAVSSAMIGDSGRCDALLEQLRAENATGPGLLAVLSNQIQRLTKVRAQVLAGRSAEDASRGLAPPVYPSQLPAFLKEVERWPLDALEALGRAVHDADVACKRAGSPDLVIAARLLHAVASRRARS